MTLIDRGKKQRQNKARSSDGSGKRDISIFLHCKPSIFTDMLELAFECNRTFRHLRVELWAWKTLNCTASVGFLFVGSDFSRHLA